MTRGLALFSGSVAVHFGILFGERSHAAFDAYNLTAGAEN